VDFVLVDWTRMGRVYCLAGAIYQAGGWRIVRPLPARQRGGPVRNAGWSPFLLDGHARWELFELVRPEPADPAPPHLEDVWVRDLRPRKALAAPQDRRAILQTTLRPGDKPLFGAPLERSFSSTYLQPGQGERSLASVLVPAVEVGFTALWREGAAEADYRVRLPLPGMGARELPVKDHTLLGRVEQAHADLDARLVALRDAVRGMGASVVVRLGLSRAFQGVPGRSPARCWLMADGFYSLDDPQS
jgi:hypothetical protein